MSIFSKYQGVFVLIQSLLTSFITVDTKGQQSRWETETDMWLWKPFIICAVEHTASGDNLILQETYESFKFCNQNIIIEEKYKTFISLFSINSNIWIN